MDTVVSEGLAVEARGLTKIHGSGRTAVTALADVSLDVAEGEFLAVVGPSGSGKTTLLSVIGGLTTPTQGTIRVAGVELTGRRAAELAAFRASSLGFVFQDHHLMPYLTARENLTVVASLLPGRADTATIGRRADELLAAVGLDGRRDHLPSALSGGERQRVAVARALMNQPRVLLVDEPTANLDSRRGEEVVTLIAGQAAQRDVAVVMVTHDERMAARAVRQLALADGRLVDGGAAA